ncbi:phospholipase A2 inhibitor NAI-like [Elgaria multicarinata webbii]|uniref:phospholipase A2 inhibitor NAI-like n=1 Tax=Elgaria multicarinata webbii TaxID=159646 RepID=UPI002FCD13CE
MPNYNHLKPNGLQCPSCFSRNSDYCDSQGRTVQCRGTEDQCVDMTFDMSLYGLPNQRITVQGCANKALCFYPMGKSYLGNGLLQFDIFSKYCQSVKGSSKQPETKG